MMRTIFEADVIRLVPFAAGVNENVGRKATAVLNYSAKSC